MTDTATRNGAKVRGEKASLVPPHDVPAERAILGYVWAFKYNLPDVANHITASDFYVPAHQTLWQAAVDLHREGRDHTDPVVLSDYLRSAGVNWDWPELRSHLADFMGSVSGTGWQGPAAVMEKLANHRRLLTTAYEALTQAQEATMDPLDLRDLIAQQLEQITTPGDDGRPIPGLTDLGAIVERKIADVPWAVPGIIRVGHRGVFVAPEGAGKTTLMRQIAWCAQAGLHPFTRLRMEYPIHTLIGDFENPPEAVSEIAKMIHRAMAQSQTPFPTEASVWERPRGINLRNRRDRQEFERVIARTRPELVCAGPLYKMYRNKPGEDSELVVLEVQDILDDLRTRYNFALLLEHHAPHGDSKSGKRDLRPIGTTAWIRWPELGRNMARVETATVSDDPAAEIRPGQRAYTVGDFRGDRVKVAWPDVLVHGKIWPFDGWYFDHDGYMTQPPKGMGG